MSDTKAIKIFEEYEYSCNICGRPFSSLTKLSRDDQTCSAKCETIQWQEDEDATYERARDDNFERYR